MPDSDKKLTPVKRIISRIFLSGVVVVVLAFLLVKPNWLAHFIATSFCICFGTGLLFFYGFHPRSHFIGSKTKLARQSESTQRNAKRVIRCLVIALAASLFYFVDISILVDWTHFVRDGRPYLSELKGRVNNNDILFGAFFLNQTLHLTTKRGPLPQPYFAMFFPKVAHFDNTYWFLIAPKSGLVLDWQPAGDSTNSPAWK